MTNTFKLEWRTLSVSFPKCRGSFQPPLICTKFDYSCKCQAVFFSVEMFREILLSRDLGVNISKVNHVEHDVICLIVVIFMHYMLYWFIFTSSCRFCDSFIMTCRLLIFLTEMRCIMHINIIVLCCQIKTVWWQLSVKRKQSDDSCLSTHIMSVTVLHIPRNITIILLQVVILLFVLLSLKMRAQS